jgi:hypothetical protein
MSSSRPFSPTLAPTPQANVPTVANVHAHVRSEGLDPGPRWNILDPNAPGALFLESMGVALAALHTVPLDAAHAAGVSVVWLDAERETLGSAMRETRAVLSPSPATWQRWLAYVEDDAAWVHPTALSPMATFSAARAPRWAVRGAARTPRTVLFPSSCPSPPRHLGILQHAPGIDCRHQSSRSECLVGGI